MYGYAGKMLFVNLSDSTYEVRELTEKMARDYPGGYGLGAKVLYNEMPAHTEVFSEDSMMGFVPGPADASGAFFGGRYTVVSKSPVWGGWNDANSGGSFGPWLKRSGYDAVFVKGIAPKPVYIFIDDGKVEIRDAGKLWGLTVCAAEEAIKDEIGNDKLGIALIGPAGERKSYMAAVMNDGHRAAARGGTGAVMGSKNLKALVCRGNFKVEVADKEALVKLNREISEALKGPRNSLMTGFGQHGTGANYSWLVRVQDCGIKNWAGASGVDFDPEKAKACDTITSDNKYPRKKFSCYACPIGCGAIYNLETAKWPLKHTARPEYESIGTFGSMCCVDDQDAGLKCNDLCNEYGLDTISVGATVAWAMECYDKGILTRDELDGIDLCWGNAEGMVQLTEKICSGQGCGKILALGSYNAAKKLGKGMECTVTATGIELPMHDPRFAVAFSRMYKYDPTPGRHVKGYNRRAGVSSPPDTKYVYRGTGYHEMDGMIQENIVDCAGFCYFLETFGLGSTTKEKVDYLNAITGFGYTQWDAKALGVRLLNIRHAFNLREGFRKKDFFLSERLTSVYKEGPLAGIDVPTEFMAENFFNAVGWDVDTLVPIKSSLEDIGGMEEVLADLY